MLTVVLAAAAAQFPQEMPPLSLADDTVPVPFTESERRQADPQETKVIFLNFDGQTLSCEGDYAPLNNSRLACPPQALTDIPPFNPAGYTCGSVAACKETIRAMLVERYADWNVRFVTERPEDGDYEMAMIGGSGNGVGEGVLGIAPLDCLNSNPNSVSFSFAADVGGTPCPEEVLATTIAHELGHAFGLCHNNEASSIMYPAVNGCDQTWTCGAAADACGCGNDTFCPPEYLGDILGPAPPDSVDPQVQILSPLSGVRVPAQFRLHAMARDDRILDIVEVSVNATQVAEATPDVTGQYEWNLPPAPVGHVRVCVVGRDAEGNEGRDCVNVTVDPAADCIPGDCCCGASCCEPEECNCSDRLPNGEECSLDQDCRGGLCEDNPWDEQTLRLCTESCAEDAECPPGMACVGGRASGRGECWSYVAENGLGRPCHRDEDCGQAFIEDGGLCLDEGFCSQPCGASQACPPLFTCADIGGARHCRFVGAHAEVGGGCTVAGSAQPLPFWLGLLGLIGLTGRGVLHPRRGGRERRSCRAARGF